MRAQNGLQTLGVERVEVANRLVDHSAGLTNQDCPTKGMVPRLKGLAGVIGTIQTDSGTVGSDRHFNSASRGQPLIRSCTLAHLLVDSGGPHREKRLLRNPRSWADNCSLLGVRSRNEAPKS